ncbi:MAG: D-2-hydroxyacid dehydrogenase [Planctomycetota bacterium]
MKVLIHLVSSMRCWTLGDEQLAKLRSDFPEHELLAATNKEMALANLPGAEVYWGWVFEPGWVAMGKKLRWVATPAAGLDWVASEELRASGIPVTRGTFHGRIISESILAMMLSFERRLEACRRMQRAGEWSREILDGSGGTLAGKTLGVIGAGNVGTHVARKAKCFEMRTLGVRRQAARPEFPFDAIFGTDGLRQALSQSDHIVLCLPSTKRTTRLIGERELAWMKPSAYLYNVGRGNCVDERALIRALEKGRLAGAGLDVFEEEPLRAQSKLRGMENVIVTPHAAAIAPTYLSLAEEEFVENLRRLDAGEPLLHVVDPESDLWEPAPSAHSPAD